MRVHVDRDLCDLHGQCVFAAPDVFRFDTDGELQYVADVDESRRAQAEEAATLCPAMAIELHR
jgi:ferredoxin